MRKIALPLLILFALTLIGCGASHRPVLYPNNHLKTVGNAQAQRDIDECMQTAETYVKKNQDSKVAEGAVKGGAVGAAIRNDGQAVREAHRAAARPSQGERGEERGRHSSKRKRRHGLDHP